MSDFTAPSIQEARHYARKYGAKILVHGIAGSGKTPLINTAPSPILMITEPGTASLYDSKVPAFEAYKAKDLDNALKWMKGSQEFAKKYATIGIDSVSQIAEIYLNAAKHEQKISHGMQQYGWMAEKTREWVDFLYYVKGKHTYLICKQQSMEVAGIYQLRPHFPGKDLNVYIPHLFDIILCLGTFIVPERGTVKAFQCRGDECIMARDRFGKLAEYERPNLSYIIDKVMK